jgi:hypothetical protein
MTIKFISTVFALLIVGTTLAQTPSNSDFESWANPPSKTYENPVGWSTSNDIVGDFGLTNVTKVTSPVQSGTYATKLESIDIFGLSTASALVGIVNINPLDQSLTPGAAYTSRPDSITGFFQYTPASGDNFLVLAIFTKWNGISRDTIGSAKFVEDETINTYTRFSIPVEYENATIPDSLTFIISSSEVLNNAIPGSIAFVDNINFVGSTTNISKHYLNNLVELFPNPANEFISVQGLPYSLKVQINNIHGQVLKSQIFNTNFNRINIADLPNGLYNLKGEGISKRFIVAH